MARFFIDKRGGKYGVSDIETHAFYPAANKMAAKILKSKLEQEAKNDPAGESK